MLRLPKSTGTHLYLQEVQEYLVIYIPIDYQQELKCRAKAINWKKNCTNRSLYIPNLSIWHILSILGKQISIVFDLANKSIP